MSDDNDDVYLFIGNSDVGTFKLVYGSQVRVMRYSTATAKGLGQNNKNSQNIWETLHSKYSRVDLSAIVWVFGSVDAKFSYYFKLCHEWDGKETDRPDPYKLMEECAVKYVQFVKKVHDEFLLPKQTNAKTVVLGAEPNGAVPSLLFEQCVKYFVTPDTPENKRRVMASIAQHHPDSLRLKLNESLRKACLENNLSYVDLDDVLLDQPGVDAPLDVSVTKKEFTDISPTSVHLNWEGVLTLYIEKLRAIGVNINDTLDLDSTRDEYIHEKQNRKRKPMAVIEERWLKSLNTHIDEREVKQR